MDFNITFPDKEKREMIEQEILFAARQYRRRGENFIVKVYGKEHDGKDEAIVRSSTLVEITVNDGENSIVFEEGHETSNYTYGSLNNALTVLDHFYEVLSYRIYPVEVELNINYLERDDSNGST